MKPLRETGGAFGHRATRSNCRPSRQRSSFVWNASSRYDSPARTGFPTQCFLASVFCVTARARRSSPRDVRAAINTSVRAAILARRSGERPASVSANVLPLMRSSSAASVQQDAIEAGVSRRDQTLVERLLAPAGLVSGNEHDGLPPGIEAKATRQTPPAALKRSAFKFAG
jgi:hypothetical protein